MRVRLQTALLGLIVHFHGARSRSWNNKPVRSIQSTRTVLIECVGERRRESTRCNPSQSINRTKCETSGNPRDDEFASPSPTRKQRPRRSRSNTSRRQALLACRLRYLPLGGTAPGDRFLARQHRTSHDCRGLLHATCHGGGRACPAPLLQQEERHLPLLVSGLSRHGVS